MTEPDTTARQDLALCSFPDCGRPHYAQGLCQTHHHHKRKTGEIKPIRPYRKRKTETVKFAGLRVTPGCASELRKYAKDQGISLGAAIADVLEGWTGKRKDPHR